MNSRIAGILVTAALLTAGAASGATKPNIIFMLADDIGYGDLGCYGATKVKTPNVDRLSREGLRFTDAHSTSGTCTPTRYGILTGQYPWRKKGTGILPGDASLIIPTDRPTLPSMMKGGGYTTGCVGKWHLGLGDGSGLDWNGEIKPGPREIGFDYSFIIPATGDRVPCVYVENRRVVGLDPADPIQVSYGKPIGDEPTGRARPDLLKMKFDQGHDQTIVNGISRIGYMSGGRAARWKDEDMADTITAKAVAFIEGNKDKPFFLYFATHDIHVPRVPHARYAGSSGCGVRGDVIQEFDGSVGKIAETLERLGIAGNTMFIITSDNGPVVADGYADGAPRDLNGHTPAGPLRGHKYSIYEGGTRMPLIVHWPGRVKAGVSDALVCQVDLIASLASIAGIQRPEGAGPDSEDVSAALLGKSGKGRKELVEHDGGRAVALRRGAMKFIAGAKNELYDLAADLGEERNLAGDKPGVAREMNDRLNEITGPLYWKGEPVVQRKKAK